MCVQVWVVCLSADGRPYSGGWLLLVFVLIFTLVFLVVCLFLSVCVCCLFVFCGQYVRLYARVQSLCSPPQV